MRTSITLAASACRRFVRRGAWLLLPSAIAGSAGAQVVHVVGTRDGPGVEFTSVQAAVDTAASGDVLLLLPGDHAGPVTVGKSLVLLGAPAADGSAPSQTSVSPLGNRCAPEMKPEKKAGLSL